MERAIIDKREMQLLYRDGDDYVFMDNETVRPAERARPRRWATAPTSSSTPRPPSCMMYGDEIIGVELPASVELNIAETEPGVQGDRVSGAKKPATLETGLVVPGAAVHQPGRARSRSTPARASSSPGHDRR